MNEKPNPESAEGAEALRHGADSREGLTRVTHGIIASAIEVHRTLGPGLLESVYEECLCYELLPLRFAFMRQLHIPAANRRVGLLINFNVPVLKNGLKRMVNNYSESGAERIGSASSASQLREDKSSDSLVSSLRSSPRPGDSAVNSRPQ